MSQAAKTQRDTARTLFQQNGLVRMRDLPAAFGKWNAGFKRFRDRVKVDVVKRLFDAVSDDPTWNMR